MDLEEALARIAELEGQLSALAGERDAAVGEATRLEAARAELAAQRATLDGQLAEATSARDAARTALGEAEARGLTHLRRALLAEHAGQVVPELVAGDTAEALEASVEVAKEAYTRVLETARAALAGQAVPAGAPSARAVSAGAGLTPLELIEAGLRR